MNKNFIDEAVKRMKLFNISNDAIRAFKKKGVISYSDFQGTVYPVLECDCNSGVLKEVMSEVRSFEKRTSAHVYHIIQSITDIGVMWSFLYVGDPSGWVLESEDIGNGMTYAYIFNSTYPEHSELGSIMVKPKFGGLVRIA